MKVPPWHFEFTHIVVVAASAGGIEAMSQMLKMLDANFSGTIAIVQHRMPDAVSHLAELLRRRIKLRVSEGGPRLERGVIHLAMPDFHLLVNADATLTDVKSEKVHHQRPSANLLFESAAKHFGGRVTGVVLSGADGDGTAGIGAIKRHGGMTIAQTPESSQVNQMPRSAIASGMIDYVLTPREIGEKLEEGWV